MARPKLDWPTNKWWAALVTATSALIVNLINSGFSKEIAVALVGLIAQQLVAYIVPNNQAPGGVRPRKR